MKISSFGSPRVLSCALALCCSLGLAACDDGDAAAETADAGGNADPVIRILPEVYENSVLGITVDDAKGAPFGYAADGSLEINFDALVTIESQGARRVEVAQFIDSVAAGGRQTVFTLDLESNEERVFHYEPEDGAVVIGDMEGGVFVFHNDDGSYDLTTALFDDEDTDALEFVHADDGYAALQALQEYNQFTDTSNYSLVMAYAMAQRPALETRFVMACKDVLEPGDSPLTPICSKPESGFELNVEGGRYKQARPKAICETFAAFCDCVACQAAGVGENCELCPAR